MDGKNSSRKEISMVGPSFIRNEMDVLFMERNEKHAKDFSHSFAPKFAQAIP